MTHPPQTGFWLWIVSPDGYPHSRCFEEVALALSGAFDELGLEAPIVTRPEQIGGTAIVLGANLLPHLSVQLPPRLVLYNLEQVQAQSTWITPGYLDLLRRHTVWDYSPRNIETLAAAGVAATLCGIGYSETLRRIPAAPEQDIDVLFVGSMNPRRRAVLQALRDRGVKVVAAYDVYGDERDALISRAKIVLNLHFFEAKVLEVVRVSYLLANGVCVVSEEGSDKDLEAPFRDGVAFAPYEDLCRTCLDLLARPAQRHALAAAGQAAFVARPQAPMLARALASLPRGLSGR